MQTDAAENTEHLKTEVKTDTLTVNIRMLIDIDSITDLDGAKETARFLQKELQIQWAAAEKTGEEHAAAVADLHARISHLRKTHDQDIERTIQKMERKVEARDFAIVALQETIARIVVER